MEYIAPRKMTAVSISGRSVEFEKGVPTYAPPQMHAELIKLGIVPAEEIPEPEDPGNPKEPTLESDRRAAFYAAFERLVLRNKRNDFSGTGIPHSAVLAKEMGWTEIDRKERDQFWQQFNSDKAL